MTSPDPQQPESENIPNWTPVCEVPWCGKALTTPGALLFSPPIAGQYQGAVLKRHICAEHFNALMDEWWSLQARKGPQHD